MSATTPKKQLQTARKSAGGRESSTNRNNGGGTSSRTNVQYRSTDSVYNVPAFSKFMIGCTLYRYLREFWDKNGMPFLQRTLLYEQMRGLSEKTGERTLTNSIRVSSPINQTPTKRLKTDSHQESTRNISKESNHHDDEINRSKNHTKSNNTLHHQSTSKSCGDLGSASASSSTSIASAMASSMNNAMAGGESIMKMTKMSKNHIEWKPFSTKIVFESVHDRTGATGGSNVDICLLKTDENGIVSNHITRGENGTASSPISSTVNLPRNPPSSSAGAGSSASTGASASNGQSNGHIPPSITIPWLNSSIDASNSSAMAPPPSISSSQASSSSATTSKSAGVSAASKLVNGAGGASNGTGEESAGTGSGAGGGQLCEPSVGGRMWVLFRCKLPMPRASKSQKQSAPVVHEKEEASRRGLRDSIQRRASASLTPLKSDYCYGCLEVSNSMDQSDGVEDGSEITVFMKRVSSKYEQQEKKSNGRVSTMTNGGRATPHMFNFQVLKDLISDNDDTMEETNIDEMPTMKLRMYQTRIQHRVSIVQMHLSKLSPTKYDSAYKYRSDRLESICSRLPRPLIANFGPISHRGADRSSPNSPSSEDASTSFWRLGQQDKKSPAKSLRDNCSRETGGSNGKNRIDVRFNIEYQQQQQQSGTIDHRRRIEAMLSRVNTRMDDSHRCAMCEQRVGDTYALFQHVRTCHARWSFVVKELNDGYQMDIRPAQYYDGRLETRVNRRRFNRRKAYPIKRRCVQTTLLAYRPHDQRYTALGCTMMTRSLDEFKTCPKDVETHEAKERAEFMLHHVRHYYHSQTCQKVTMDEFDDDSEDEMDPEWLRDRTKKMIDEFTDVNEGEKSIMKMWNLHIMKYNYSGDTQIYAACDTFITVHGRQVLLENLRRNFILHLANLHSFGLLSPGQVLRLTNRLHSMM